MTIGLILLGLWALMDGGNGAKLFTLNGTFLSTWLFITGIVIIIEYFAGFELPRFKGFHRNTTV